MKTSRKNGSLRAKGFLLSAGLLALFTTSAPTAQAQELPKTMGSIGDSMTAGALASFRRQHFILPWEQIRILAKLVHYGTSRDMDAVEARHLSWAGGYDKHRKVYSHSYRLSAMAGLDDRAIPTANVAVSGAESADIYDQMLRLNEWSENNHDQAYPDYVTLMIGPNDVCADSAREMVSDTDYYSNVTNVVDEILSKSPKTKIMMGGIPNIESLRRVARKARLHVGLKCEQLWKTIKICPTLTTIDDPNERAMVANRVAQYNTALRDIASTRSESHGDRIRYANKPYEMEFTSKDLSVDCFHPNPEGQQKLADSTFESTWWADKWEPVKKQIEAKAEAEKKRRCNRARRRSSKGRRVPGC